MSWNLPPVLPATRQQGESADWVTAFDQMAALETLACGPYGLRRVHSLPPELLSGEFPEAVRWSPDMRMTSKGMEATGSAHPGGVRLHIYTVRIFVAMGPRGQKQEDLMRQSAWVPRAWDEAYNLNRTLDSTVRGVVLDTRSSPARYESSVGYGRLNKVLQLYQGWLFTATLRLEYVMGAS